jgi:hypothetical protein
VAIKLTPPFGYCKRCLDRIAVVHICGGSFLDGGWCRTCLELVAPSTYAIVMKALASVGRAETAGLQLHLPPTKEQGR